MRRVVITSYGVNSCFGFGADSLQKGLEENRSGIAIMDDLLKCSDLQCKIAACVGEYKVDVISRTSRRSMGKVAHLGALAALEAVERSRATPEMITSPRTGCIMSSTMGSASELYGTFDTFFTEKSMQSISGMQFFKCASHTVAMNVAQMLGIRGSVLSPSAACASSMQAIGLGFQLIRSGVLDMALCGGAEEVNFMVVGSFETIFATAPESRNDKPQTASRPFDSQRDGLVCGEGAGVIIIESLESALARNANILGEIIGYNTSASGTHISQSDSTAIRACIDAALRDANISSKDIDYVSAHATGTPQGDAAEAEALFQIFGDKVSVSSLKGGLGHTMGASGAIELAACLMMMRDSVIYPTRNLENPANDCSKLNHIQNLTPANINCFIKNSFAFGGINATLVCRKFNG